MDRMVPASPVMYLMLLTKMGPSDSLMVKPENQQILANSSHSNY
jgi:hypothetical protein